MPKNKRTNKQRKDSTHPHPIVDSEPWQMDQVNVCGNRVGKPARATLRGIRRIGATHIQTPCLGTFQTVERQG